MAKADLYVDVAIVGVGVLGALIAARMEEFGAGLKVIGFRLADAPHPRAESLRNQGLLQSGMRYLWHPVLAGLLRSYRSQLLDYCVMRASEVRGAMQIPLDDYKQFFEQIRATPYEREVEELGRDDARAAFGHLWREDGFGVLVPEHQLDVTGVMEQSRQIARSYGVTITEVRSVRIESTRSGGPVRLKVDDRMVEARVVIFTAGCGNILFLDELKPDHGYTVTQTPLLIARGPPKIAPPVMYDRMRHISISAHRANERVRDGCMVIGAAVPEEDRLVDPRNDTGQRDEHAEDGRMLFEKIKPLFELSEEQCSITAGWEPRPPDGEHMIPQVIDFAPDQENRNVLVAFCGRATLAMYAADLVFEKLRPLLEENLNRRPEPTRRLTESIGQPWSTKPRMHYEDEYRFRSDLGFRKRLP